MSNVYCSFTMKSDDVGATHSTMQYLKDENARLLWGLHEERRKNSDQTEEV